MACNKIVDLYLPSDPFLVKVQVASSKARLDIDAFKTRQKLDSSHGTFLAQIYSLCLALTSFAYLYFILDCFHVGFLFSFLAALINCFVSVMFKLKCLYCKTLTCHF